jgi:hypothetical protein
MSTHVIFALKAKRAELSGQVIDMEKRIAEARGNLVHIDACLRLFGWNEEPGTIKPRRPPMSRLFGRNELPRFIFDHLRQHPEGVTTRQIAEAVCADRKWDGGNRAFMDGLVHKIGGQMPKFRARGQVVSEPRGHIGVWRLTDGPDVAAAA